MKPTEEPLQAMIDRANGESDPVLCNLKITLAHRRLAQLLSEITGAEAGANFHSWAVWGSKKAGVTVRQEDLDDALRNATVVSGVCGGLVGLAAAALIISGFELAALLSLAGLALGLVGGAAGVLSGALVGRAIARWSRRQAAQLVLDGNRLVLDDIGRQTARFYAAFAGQDAIEADKLETFLDGMQRGPAAEGGQDLLREAFRQYARAANATDPAKKHQAAYYANCLAILNEHIKLQPYIEGSLPFIVRKCVTARMLTFEIGPLTMAVSEDVPSLASATFPSTLSVLSDRSLLTFLSGDGGWAANQDSVTGSAARDWSRLRDRMAYIVKLFRCYHLHESVHAPPYSDHQVVAIESGSIPEGRL